MKLTRRALLGRSLALPLGLTLSPAASLRALAAPAADAPIAIIMNSGESSVSVIDMRTHQVIKEVPTMREPSHWALTPDRSQLYIADASGNALTVLDPRTGALLGQHTIADPYQLGFTPDHRYLVVNALRLNFVDVYDARDLRLVKRFSPGGMPSHLDFSPDSRWSFNSMQSSGTLVSFDMTTLTQRWSVKVGSTPAGVLWHNGKVLVCVMGTDYIAEVDPVSGQILRKARTGIGPHNVFLSPDKSTLYVTNRVGGSLVALDPVTFAIRRTYPFKAMGPDDIQIAPDGKLWIALRFHGQVAVLDPASGHVDTIDVGNSPHGIFLSTELTRQGRVTAQAL